MLLDCKADVNLGAAPDALPLSYVMEHDARLAGNPELIRRIIRQGADLNETRINVDDIRSSAFSDASTTPPLLAPLPTAPPALVWASKTAFHTLAHDANIRRLDDWIRRKLSDTGLGTLASLLQQLDLLSEDIFLAAYDQSLIKLCLDHGADVDITFHDPQANEQNPYPMTALETVCSCISRDGSAHVFWNAVFLLHSGANSRFHTESGSSAIDWLLRIQGKRGRRPPSALDS